MIYCFIGIPVAVILFTIVFVIRHILKTHGILGFTYDERAGVFCSVKRNWQTYFGYQRNFDEVCIKFNMVLESEPVYFHYDGYDWLIELWKGQYGITTGGELGIYRKKAKRHRRNFDPAKIHYDRVPSTELLQMGISIWTKEGRRLFYREAHERWLNGFALGECHAPDTLCMQARIVFKEEGMQAAFAGALYALGYTPSEMNINENAVSVNFDIPKSTQPKSNTKLAMTRKMFFLCSLAEEFNDSIAMLTDANIITSRRTRRKLNPKRCR